MSDAAPSTPPSVESPETPPATPTQEALAEFSPFEQQFLEVINERFPVNEGHRDSADGEEQGTPESEPTAAPGGEEPAEGPGTEPPATETSPDEGGAPGGEHGQSAPVFTLSGQDYTPEQLNEAIQVHDWFARLDAGAVQAIDGVLSGQYRLVPAQEAVAQPQPPAAAVSSGQTPSATAPTDDDGEWLDPRAQAEISALRQQINELTQSFQSNLSPVVQRQMDADFQSRLDAITEASNAFRERYDLEPEQIQALESSIVEAQVLPSLSSRFGSIGSGMNAALEMFFWTTPDYRDPFLKKQQAANEAEHDAQDAATVRKQHLTALSASGGSAPRREPVPSTSQDRHAAMTAEIAAAMNGSGTVQ